MGKLSTAKKRHELIVRRFHKELRSDKDYDTKSMYETVAKKSNMSPGTIQNIVRDYYTNYISDEMRDYFNTIRMFSGKIRISMFAGKFKLCERESRVIMSYLTYPLHRKK